MPDRIRILEDPPLDGAANMARDEALLDVCAAGEGSLGPTVRLYAWSPPAVSIGRRQPANGACDPVFLAAHGIDLVRRPTGGRAVLHEHELTYAVVGEIGSEAFPGGVLDTYRRIADVLLRALRALGAKAVAVAPERGGSRDPGPLGPPACFDRAGTYEIAVDGKKLLGSAQLRRRGAFLQHGSLLLRADPQRLARAIGLSGPPGRLTDLESVLGSVPDPRTLRDAIVAGFESGIGLDATPGSLTEREADLASTLRRTRYATRAWTMGDEA